MSTDLQYASPDTPAIDYPSIGDLPRVGVIAFNLGQPNVSLADRIAQAVPCAVSLYPLASVQKEYTPTVARLACSPSKPVLLPIKSLKTKEWMCVSPGISLAWKALRENDVVVMLGLLGLAGLTVRLLNCVFRRPLAIATQQIGLDHERKRSWLLRAIKRLVLSRRFWYLCQTPPTRDVLTIGYNIPEFHILDAPFTVTDAVWRESLKRTPNRISIRNSLGMLDDKGFVALFVGSLLELKGVDVLIDAFANMAAGTDELWLVGGLYPGQERFAQSIHERASALAVTIRFFDDIDYHRLPLFYKAADVFVLPSRKDTWPKVLIEAAAAGLPLITTDVCGSAGYVVKDGVNGLIVASGRAEPLARGLRELRESPTLRKEMGLRSREIAGNYIDGSAEAAGFAEFIRLASQLTV